jgi:hypothetical protein
MHISLDSALGRQRRLNSVGESVFQIAPDASAGYSLRSLTGGDPSVVRVRRDSDNGERDFRSSEINSGEMVSWVNQQAIKPLDIRELEADGRTGDFLIPKAAYSLRSLGARQATLAATGDTVARADGKFVMQARRTSDQALKSFTAAEVADGTLTEFANESFTSRLPLDVAGGASAAYGLRNLSSSYTGSVVEVRRSSDDTTQNFTATEITDGTLLAFVNEDVELFSNDFETNTSGFTLNTGGSNVAVRNTSDGFSGSGCLQLNLTSHVNTFSTVRTDTYMQDTDGVTYTVSFYAKAISGSANLVLKIGTTGSSSQQISFSENGGEWVKHSLTFVNNLGAGSGNRNQRLLFAGSTSNTTEWRIDDFKIVQTTSNGHVKTWYDQSGNSNHATQGTSASQPKIVDGGNLVDGGLDFDGANDSFSSIPNLFSGTSAASSFIVGNADSTGVSEPMFVQGDNRSIVGNAFVITSEIAFRPGGNTIYDDTFIDANSLLLSTIVPASSTSADALMFLDGGALGQTSTTSATLNYSNQGAFIGSTFSGSAFYDGRLSEIIIYPSDQTDKRRAIEESIATANGITLIPFSRDAFVTKWYDQSVTNQAGNVPSGNHAVQATTGFQPKIVTSGALVTGGLDFDGGNDKLDIPNDLLSSVNSASAFLIADPDTTSGGQAALALSRNDPDFRFYVGGIFSGNFTFGYENSASKIILGSANTNKHLFTSIAGSSIAEGFLDGTSKGSVSSVDGISALTNGGIGAINSSSFWNGTIQEVIIYNSDQSDNRTALEANIGEAYSIAGIPAYANTVNGFVETWYDQSGNGKDATQLTAANQPNIVYAGNLVAGGLGFFTNDLLETASLGASQPITAFSVFTQDSASSTIYGSSGSHALITSSSNTISLNAGTALVSSASIGIGTPALVSSLANSTSSFIFINGGNTTTGNAGTTGITGSLKLGSTNSNRAMEGELQEFIIYNSDQTANRIAIETNINSHYDIF